MNPAASITCPLCASRPGEGCATSSGMPTGIHMSRIKALHALRRATDPRQTDLFRQRSGTKQGQLFEERPRA